MHVIYSSGDHEICPYNYISCFPTRVEFKGTCHDVIFQSSLFSTLADIFIFRDSSYGQTYTPKQSCRNNVCSAREQTI